MIPFELCIINVRLPPSMIQSWLFQDYRMTACMGLLMWLTETYGTGGYAAVADAMAEVNLE